MTDITDPPLLIARAHEATCLGLQHQDTLETLGDRPKLDKPRAVEPLCSGHAAKGEIAQSPGRSPLTAATQQGAGFAAT